MSSYTPHVKSQFIRAGAGAGKTTQLIQSFIEFNHDFLQNHGRLPKVIMTTFTRKATQEVKERLLVEALKRNDQKVFEHINKKSSVHISTIHGLLHLFLSQFHDLLSLPHEIKILDQNIYEKNIKKNLYILMKHNPEYVEILDHYPFSKLVTIALQALNYRAEFKEFDFVRADSLKQLCEQKQNKVINLLNCIFAAVPSVPDKWVEYFEYLKKIKNCLLENNENLLLESLQETPRKPTWNLKKPAFAQEGHDLIEQLREIDIFSAVDTQAYRTLHENINQLFKNLVEDLYLLDQTAKKNKGELTISDIETLSLKLINEFPQAAQEFSDSWDFFMIDEYQDTSPLQVKILNELIQKKPCFIVGDPQQSIYLFRGARSEVFFEKEKWYQASGSVIKVLDRNYRSDPALMAFINDFFSQTSQQFKPMKLKERQISKEKSSANAVLPQAHYVQTYDETHAVLKKIETLFSAGIQAKDICVLSRRNSSLIKIANLAYEYNIPVQLQAAAGFESQREILDLVAFLKFLINPHDNDNLVTLLRSPWFYVTDQILLEVAQASSLKKCSFWIALKEQKSEIYFQLNQIQIEYETEGVSVTLKKFIHKSHFLAVSELLDPSGQREANIWKFVQSLAESERQVGFSLGSFIQNQFQTLSSDLGSSDSEAQPVIQPDRVSLMTVHASKGLEFKHVIVIGFSDRPQTTKTLPLAFDPIQQRFSLAVYDDQESKLLSSEWSQLVRRSFNQRELEESERVLYVALTRAKDTLTLISRQPKEDERNFLTKDCWFNKTVWPSLTEQPIIKKTDDGEYILESTFSKDQASINSQQLHDELQIRPVYQSASSQNLQAVSVTALLEPDVKKKSLGSSQMYHMTFENLKKAQAGTDLHRIFESLKYLPLENILLQLSVQEKILVQYLVEQKQIDLLSILKVGYTEWGFGLKTDQGFMQGQIDAWSETEEEIHVLDYKTGRVDYAEKAFQQLAIYTKALLKMKKISSSKRIVHSVLYPADQVIKQKIYSNANQFLKEIGAP